MSARTRDLWVGLGTAALFAYILLAVIPEQIRTPGSISSVVMSPAFWPSVTAGLAIVLGLALAAKSLFAPSDGNTDDGESSPTTWHSITAIAIMIGYYLILEPLGIVLASVLVLPTLSLLFGERRVTLLAPVALLLPAGLYLFFTDVASIPLPLGPLSNLF